MKDFGYDVSDYRDVDPLFGSLSDFEELLNKAHAKGLRILIDLVLSHTSDQHPWFKESRQSADNSGLPTGMYGQMLKKTARPQ